MLSELIFNCDMPGALKYWIISIRIVEAENIWKGSFVCCTYISKREFIFDLKSIGLLRREIENIWEGNFCTVHEIRGKFINR